MSKYDTLIFSSIKIFSSNLNIWMINNHFSICHIFQHKAGRAIKTKIHQVKLIHQFVGLTNLLRSYYVPAVF